jgi:hypothetical protein
VRSRAWTSRRKVAVFVLAGLGVAALGGSVRSGNAATSTKYYSTALAPASVGVGATAPETLTLSNSALSSQTLGSENVTVPSGYSATAGAVTAPTGKAWTATVSAGVVQLRAKTTGDALAPGESVSVSLTVNVPCDPTASGAVWTTEAKQSNGFNGPPGNAFALVPKTSDPALTTTGSCSFRFATIASPQTAGTPIDVTVYAVDGAGVDTTSFNGPATLSGFSSTHASYGSLSFTNGLGSATSTATDYTAETGQTLTATAGSITGTSNPFDVNPAAPNYLTFAQQPTNTAVNVAIAPPVTVDVYDQYGNLENLEDPSANQVSVTLSIANDAGGGSTVLGPAAGTTQTSSGGVATFAGITLNHSGIGFTLSASSTGLTSGTSEAFDVLDKICLAGVTTCTVTNSAGNTQVTTDFGTKTLGDTGLLMSVPGAAFDCSGAQHAKGSLVTIVPPSGYDFSNPITTTLRFDKSIAPGTGVTNFVLCIKKDTSYSVVPDCPRKLTAKSTLPCITKRNRNGVGDLVIVMLMSSDDPVAGLH